MAHFAYMSVESAYPKNEDWDKAANELVDKLRFLQVTLNRKMSYSPTMTELLNLVYALEPEPTLIEGEYPESIPVEST